MELSFYVAGKFEDKRHIAVIMRALVAMGHTISYWWVNQEPTTDPATEKAQAALDMQGVFECDVFAALFVDPLPYLNVYVELGMALAKNKIVCVIGASHEHNCIFTQLGKVHRFETVEEFYKFIATL